MAEGGGGAEWGGRHCACITNGQKCLAQLINLTVDVMDLGGERGFGIHALESVKRKGWHEKKKDKIDVRASSV